MPSLTERGRCGDCRFFDTKRRDGSTPINLKFPDWGVCKADRGLALGIRGPESKCANDNQGFNPKREEQEVFDSTSSVSGN